MNPTASRARKRILELLVIGAAVLLQFAARSSLADHYIVPTGSMEQTIHPGDRILVDKRAYGLRVPFTRLELVPGARPARGEIAVFDSPENGIRLIKRVVAISGDVVEVRKGRVIVNGKPLALPPDGQHERFGARTSDLELCFGGGPDIGPVRVPDGSVLLLGDARGNSRDGRTFGFVREDRLYARAISVFFRTDRGFVWQTL
ncbi:MAG: signal peptidase I [Candidatus Eiseniibacteriota bacterium]